jgi:hypothetical protein
MRLGSVDGVEGINRSDHDSHADSSVVGKETLFFNDFNREVTTSGCDTYVETKSLQIVSAALGCVIPQTGKTVLLGIHQGIHLPHLEHSLLSTMQIGLHNAIVNETPKLHFWNLPTFRTLPVCALCTLLQLSKS